MQNFYSREARFSPRVLEAYARAGLPEAFTIRAAADTTEILLYDEISPWGVTAKDFMRALAQAGDGPITLRINSPGGDVFDGMAIYNALKARKSPVNVVVDGLAASAASFIAMAGDTIQMNEASMLMVHRAWGLAVGNAKDMTDTAAVLEKIDGQLADIYAARVGKSAADMMAVMQAETWLTSSEAVAGGFATGIVDAPQPEQLVFAQAVLNGTDDNPEANDNEPAMIVAQAEQDFETVPDPSESPITKVTVVESFAFNSAASDNGTFAAANDNEALEAAEAAKAAAHAARLRRVQLARIDVV